MTSMVNVNRVGAGELGYVSYPANGVAPGTRFNRVEYNEKSRQHVLFENGATESQGVPAGFLVLRMAFKVEDFRLRTACLINGNSSKASGPSSIRSSAPASSDSSSSVDSVSSNFEVAGCDDPFFDPQVAIRKSALAKRSLLPTSVSSSSVNSALVLPQQQLYNEIHEVNDFILSLKGVLEAFGKAKHEAMSVGDKILAASATENRESTSRLAKECEACSTKLMVCTGELKTKYWSTIKTRS